MEKETPQVQKKQVVEKKTKKKTPRCNFKEFKKKLSMVDLLIVCRCNKSFCQTHRFATSHKCQIDNMKELRDKLSKKLGDGNVRQIEVI